jgi:osmotically inducible protein OsmC
MPVRSSEATWRGGVHDGDGELQLGSGAWQGRYTFRSRFEADEPKKSNPEELLAAGHAGCYSLALANRLEGAGHEPDRVHTTADCHIEMDDEKGPTITRIDLETEATVEGIDDERFREMAHAAKVGCPVSRAVNAPEITLEAERVA